MSDTQKPPASIYDYGGITHISDIEPTEMEWLWKPYIPIGVASMLFGPGGFGKSHIACDIIARVTRGESFPFQDNPPIRPRRVLLLSAEDDPATVLTPRLIQAGADTKKVFIPNKFFICDPKGVRTMESIMREFDATVVFIDPVVAYMGGKIDMNKMNEVRVLTGALHAAAQATRSSIVIVHHSRKGADGEDYEKAAGSADFNNAVRSVLFVSRDKGGGFHMSHAKSNYSKLGPVLDYEFDDILGFRWTGTSEGVSAIGGKKLKAARDWLKDMLRTGPLLADYIHLMADEAGISKATLNRAKEGVAESYLFYQTPEDRRWMWRLL